VSLDDYVPAFDEAFRAGVALEYPDAVVEVVIVEKIKVSYTFSGEVTTTAVKTAVAIANDVSPSDVVVELVTAGSRRLNSPRRLQTEVDVTITASGEDGVQNIGASAAQPLTVGTMSGEAGDISVEVEFTTMVTQDSAVEEPTMGDTVAFFDALDVNITVEVFEAQVSFKMSCSDVGMVCLAGHQKKAHAASLSCNSTVCVTATDDARCCMTTPGSGMAPGSNAETFSKPVAAMLVLISSISASRVS